MILTIQQVWRWCWKEEQVKLVKEEEIQTEEDRQQEAALQSKSQIFPHSSLLSFSYKRTHSSSFFLSLLFSLGTSSEMVSG